MGHNLKESYDGSFSNDRLLTMCMRKYLVANDASLKMFESCIEIEPNNKKSKNREPFPRKISL